MFGIDMPIPALFFGAIAAIVAVAGILFNFRWALVAFALMVFASSISYSVDPYTDELIYTLFTPLQIARTFLFIGGGLLCYLVIGAHASKFVPHSINLIGVLLASIALYGGIGRVIGGYTEPGLLSIGLAVLSILPLVIVAPNLFQERVHAHAVMRAILLVLIAWLGLNAIQFVVNPGVLYPGASGRFQGLTGNPQFAAVLLAFASVTTLWVSVNDPKKSVRILAVCVTTALLVCLVWTGSRTGFGMFTIGACFVLASRIGQAILLAPIAALVGYFTLQFVLGGDVNFDPSRLTSTQNTRGGSWNGLFRTFLQNPLFGTGNPNRAGGSENSYLLALAAHGIFMGALIGALCLACAYLVFQVFRNRRHQDKLGKALSDFAMGGIAMYFAGGLLEGYIISRVHSATVFLILCTAIGRRLIDSSPDDGYQSTNTAHEHDEDSDDEWYRDERAFDEPPHNDDSAYPDESWDEPQENVWEPDEDRRERPRRKRETVSQRPDATAD